MNNSKLSIIIPVYNVERYLEECINSVKIQTFQNYEVILVDDGSTDRSSVMCDEYAEKDPRIKVIHIKNQGISKARNTGIEAAIGEYLYFLDSDDMIADQNVLTDMMRLTLYPGVDVVEGRGVNFDDGSVLPRVRLKKLSYDIVKLDEKTKRRRLCSFLAGFIFSLSLVGNTRFSSKLTSGEDILFSQQMITKAKKIVITDRICMFRRVRKGSITHLGFSKGFFENERRFEELSSREFKGKPGGEALFEAYSVDQTANINQMLYGKHRTGDMEYIRSRIIRFFPGYLKNDNIKAATKLYVTLYALNPYIFCSLLCVYQKLRKLLLSSRNG